MSIQALPDELLLHIFQSLGHRRCGRWRFPERGVYAAAARPASALLPLQQPLNLPSPPPQLRLLRALRSRAAGVPPLARFVPGTSAAAPAVH